MAVNGSARAWNPAAFTIIPPQPETRKPGQLTDAQIKQFFEEGYVVVEDFFTPNELQRCRDAIGDMVDKLADKLYRAGKIKELYKEFGLFQRLTQLEADFPGSNILLFKNQKMPKAFCDIWSNPRILNVMEQLIGPDVAGHPVWNLRTKTPHSEAVNIPWHQDSAYFSADSYYHLIPTAWIPFLDTNEENGCMQKHNDLKVVRRGHLEGKVARHTCCQGNTWYVTLEEEDMEKELGVDMKRDLLTVPVKYGGFLLFHNITPHRSLPNVSKDVRWSVDLRWQSPLADTWGFYDIQEGITFRSASNPNIKPDWEKFFSVDRKEVWQKKYFKQKNEEDEFDTTITGPWIGRWEIVNHNKHTKAFFNATSAASSP